MLPFYICLTGYVDQIGCDLLESNHSKPINCLFFLFSVLSISICSLCLLPAPSLTKFVYTLMQRSLLEETKDYINKED